ncbi:type II toxin-antitoxin system VapC family toxin [Sphingomonas sp.]|uniref:type II toxin-antitoxin system VapC family toxin n=1 Tax=Sphingomonas sp. TaxID=28214 RepID=UPI0035BC1393
MRLIVDASIWIDHLRQPEPALSIALRRDYALMHPFTLGEIALGNLGNRQKVMRELALRLQPRLARDAEVLAMVDQHHLHGRGIGWVDAHLLASTVLTSDTRLWTRDKRLMEAARELGVAAHLAN